MSVKKKFITMLIIELEDFHEDLSVLLADYRQRYQRREISETVYKENRSTLREAQNGIEQIQDRLLDIGPDRFENLDSLAAAVKSLVNEIFKDCAIPKMDQLFINKKINKVQKYLSDDIKI